MNHILRTIVPLVGALCVTLFVCTSSRAQRDGPWVKIPVVMTDFPPFEFVQDDRIVGIDAEIVREIFLRLRYLPDIQVLPWTRAQEDARNGTVAAIFSLTRNPQREKDFFFSDPLSTVKDVLFKRKDRDITWETMDDLAKYRIGISSGYQYDPVFMEAVRNKRLKTNALSGDSLELRQLGMLKSGRVDLIICEISVCTHLIRSNSPVYDMIDYIDRPVGRERFYYIGFSKQWPGARELAEKFNAELARFVEEGGRKAVFEKYGVVSSLED